MKQFPLYVFLVITDQGIKEKDFILQINSMWESITDGIIVSFLIMEKEDL